MNNRAKNKRTFIIKLEGIYLSQYSYKEQGFVQPLKDEPDLYYNSIPTKFITLDDWPNTTNLKCWICDTTFNTMPKFIPVASEMIDGAEVHEVHGNYCSWNCALEDVYLNFKNHINFYAIERSLYQIASIFEGQRVFKLKPGPPKVLRREYCGSAGLTLAEFKVRQKNDFNNYKVTPPL